MAATKFRFETSFDNGAETEASALARAHAAALIAAREDGEATGFARGHAQATTEILAETQRLLERLTIEMKVLFDTLDGVRRQLVADGALVATSTGAVLAGALVERLPQERILALVSSIMSDVIEAPRLVLRVNPAMLESTREAVESHGQSQGYAGRLIFLGEPHYKDSDITIEWANGGLSFDLLDQQQQVRDAAISFVDSILAGGDLATAHEVQQ